MTTLTIIKFQVMFAVVALSQAAYYSRMGTLVRPRAPRPAAGSGPLHRAHHRLLPAASHRAPYLIYRAPPAHPPAHQHRFAVKQFGPMPARSVFPGAPPPWRSTGVGAGVVVARPPAAPAMAAAEYELLRAASAPAQTLALHDAGGIHTIPAPNLSLSEKPIVVIDSSDPLVGLHDAAEQVRTQDHIYQMRITQPKPSYEVTEKYIEPVYQMAKIETPVGFSKTQSIPSSTEQQFLRNGAALQLAAEYGLSAVGVPRPPALPAPLHPPLVHHHPHYSVQGFQGFAVPPQQELMSTGADSVMIPPNVLYQSDPLFLQKLQQQLLQRFPALEFVPYAAELMPQNFQSNEAPQAQQVFLLENEEIKQPSESFISSESKNVVQRETQEGSLVTLLPQAFAVSNFTEKIDATTTQQPRNITLELIAAESQPATTIQHVIESSTEPQTGRATQLEQTQDTTPIYYAQVGQSVGNVIANGFYTAMNDVRAAAAMEQVLVNTPQTTKAPEDTTTISPISADLKHYFVQNEINENKTVTELKPLLGVPFAKPADSVKLAYTLLRTEEKVPKTTQEGAIYAGQIVEASITEDHDFNNQKTTLMKRAPIRLYVTDKETNSPALLASSTPKVTLVKAKIPPKSKLTFDDKTGEPVLRIYASYVDSPAQRQVVTSKLASLAGAKTATHKASRDNADSWKGATASGGGGGGGGGSDKSQGFEGNQLTKFGLKLRSRSDDYIPLFEEYDE